MLSYVRPQALYPPQIHPQKRLFRAPFALQANSLDQSVISEDNICQIQDLGNDEEYESESRILCTVKPWRPSAFQRVKPSAPLHLPRVPTREFSEYWRRPEKVPTRQSLFSGKPITSYIIEFRKRRIGSHPAERSFIERFRLDDPDYQIDNGKLLKTDQLAKNVLRWMTRYDKRLIQKGAEKGKEINLEKEYQNIFDYFSQEYSVQDFSDFDRDMLCTLYAPLKIREQKLRKESSDETSVSSPGIKKKPFLVKDRLELFSGDVDRTTEFFRHDPGRTIYFSSFKNVFLIYENTLLEMNQRKRSQGFRKFLNLVEERMKS